MLFQYSKLLYSLLNFLANLGRLFSGITQRSRIYVYLLEKILRWRFLRNLGEVCDQVRVRIALRHVVRSIAANASILFLVRVAIATAPWMIAPFPRQRFFERGQHVVQGPRQDDIVVQHDDSGN